MPLYYSRIKGTILLLLELTIMNILTAKNWVKQICRFASEPEYKGEHDAPTSGEGYAPLYDLHGVYPSDMYSFEATRMYGEASEEYSDAASIGVIQMCRYRPNQIVTVYRAVPKNLAKQQINPGDWVTINRQYAKAHGESNLRGNYRIISKKVWARDLFTDGNSIHEWGYNPQPRVNPSERLTNYLANIEREKAAGHMDEVNRLISKVSLFVKSRPILMKLISEENPAMFSSITNLLNKKEEIPPPAPKEQPIDLKPE